MASDHFTELPAGSRRRGGYQPPASLYPARRGRRPAHGRARRIAPSPVLSLRTSDRVTGVAIRTPGGQACFARYTLPSCPGGLRIATTVCALSRNDKTLPTRRAKLQYDKHIITILSYVFYFSQHLCYASSVPGRQTKHKHHDKMKRGVDHEEAEQADEGTVRELFAPRRLTLSQRENGFQTRHARHD